MRRAVALLCLALLAASFASPAKAAPKRRKLGAVVAPVKLVPKSGSTISVSGLYDFFGTIELSSASDGIVVSNHLSLETYLLGLNEVPPDWPFEALKAQAVAARTYAAHGLAQPRAGSAASYGFDICATVDCQVFSGAEVVQTEDGERWREAVEATANQVVLYDGEPILARYHSVSGGQTLNNEDAFEEEGPYPYLVSVPSTTEEASPLDRWRTSFSLRAFEAIAEPIWPVSKGRLESVYTIESRTGLHYPDVVLQGKKGRVIVDAEQLREIVRDRAPELFPALYPGPGPTSTGRLPETWPSHRIEINTKRKTVRVRGYGWGHGVGMSQWGAYGLAELGATYPDILAHYYQ